MEGIEQRGDDVLLRVRVQPKASRVKVTAEEGRVKVHVTAPPAEGLANRMVCEAVAKWLGIPKSLLLEEMEVEEVIARLPR
jgi:uncharacterized protein (TIGR00251 family)